VRKRQLPRQFRLAAEPGLQVMPAVVHIYDRKMKDLKDNLPLKAYYAITTKNLRKIETSHKTCLFGGQNCSTAIKSHSVQVSALNKIAINGHVFNFGHLSHEELDDVYNNSVYLPKQIGINDASIYYGFCDYHDNSIFTEIEKQQINPDINQIFLFHFRAYSFAYYRNITGGDALKAIYDAKRPKNHNADDALLTLSSHFQPQEEASRLTSNGSPPCKRNFPDLPLPYNEK